MTAVYHSFSDCCARPSLKSTVLITDGTQETPGLVRGVAVGIFKAATSSGNSKQRLWGNPPSRELPALSTGDGDLQKIVAFQREERSMFNHTT